MSLKPAIFTIACGALTLGCGVDPATTTREITDNLIQAGFPKADIMVAHDQVYVGRDAIVSLQASREMLQVSASSGSKEQYRTNNLVSRDLANICVDDQLFFGQFSAGIDQAVDNYNQLGLSFTMWHTNGDTSGCDAVITARLTNGNGGVSGFPADGFPFDAINIGIDLRTFDQGTITHVITHELGHTVGFRHTDFFDRSISCGRGGDEGDGGVGAILIDGTPSGAFVGGSVMNSCFRQFEPGRFTDDDITALHALY